MTWRRRHLDQPTTVAVYVIKGGVEEYWGTFHFHEVPAIGQEFVMVGKEGLYESVLRALQISPLVPGGRVLRAEWIRAHSGGIV